MPTRPSVPVVRQIVDSYKLQISGVVVDINIYTTAEESVPLYAISFLNISDTGLLEESDVTLESLHKKIEDLKSVTRATVRLPL